VVAKASVVHTNPQTDGLATGSSSLNWSVRAGGLVGANSSLGPLAAITDFDAGGNGLAAFVGFVGGMDGFRCGAGRSRQGFIDSDSDPSSKKQVLGRVRASVHPIPAIPHQVGIFTASLTDPGSPPIVIASSKTALPPHGRIAGSVEAPNC